MRNQIGRYSKYLRPLTLWYDLLVILTISYVIFPELVSSVYVVYVVFAWLITSWLTKFYEVFRFTKLIEIASKLVKQGVCFLVVLFAYTGFRNIEASTTNILWITVFSLTLIGGFKYVLFLVLKYFRRHFNGNNRKIIVIGNDTRTKELITFFTTKPEYGYHLIQHFENFDIQAISTFFNSSKGIDEVYLSLKNLNQEDLSAAIILSDDNFVTLKYIPTNKDLLTNPTKIQYYSYIPIIPEHKTPLEDSFNSLVKRIFDIVFSLFVIVFIMSWMFPLVALIIKLESKGPVLFKQKRNGLFYKEFECLKFRSMYVNNQADTLQVVKNDKRITTFGRFLRKSSIDEMPQFFNVLMGSMSVCGPRPHMLSLTQVYEKQVHRYKLRHFIKPGITGLAQTHGYRGEIISQEDIVNRVKYDIFYIENWSLMLDLKIIYLTIKNAINGEKKAY